MTTYGEYGSKAEELWSDWNFPLHSGWALNSWVRIIWVVLGLVPLLLAVTGLSTWFFKRGLRKRRKRRLRGRLSPATLQVVVLYLALVAVLAGAAAAGVRCGVAVRAGVVVGEVLLVVQAVIDVARTCEATAPARPRRISATSSSRSCCSPCWLGGRSGKARCRAPTTSSWRSRAR